MASQYPPGRADIQSLTQLVHGLKVRDLTSICVAHGLSKSGVKADLQHKITDRESSARPHSLSSAAAWPLCGMPNR